MIYSFILAFAAITILYLGWSFKYLARGTTSEMLALILLGVATASICLWERSFTSDQSTILWILQNHELRTDRGTSP